MPPAREVVPSVTCRVSSRSISVLLIFIYHILSISHIITKSSGTFYKACHCINGISPSLKLPPTEKQLAQQLPQRRTPCWGENSKYLNTSVTICSSDDRFLEVELLGQKPDVFTHFWWSSYCQIPLERWSVLCSTPSLGQPGKTFSTQGQLKIHKGESWDLAVLLPSFVCWRAGSYRKSWRGTRVSVGVCRLLSGVESCKPMSSVSWGSGQLCLLSLSAFSGDFLPGKYIAGLYRLSEEYRNSIY